MVYPTPAAAHLTYVLPAGEPRTGYKPRVRGQRRSAKPNAIPSARAELRVRVRDGGACWERIMQLNAQLTASLPEHARPIWLALEEALHGYWLDVAIEHHRLGVSAGLAQAPRPDGAHASLHDRLRALAGALARIAAELEAQSEEGP